MTADIGTSNILRWHFLTRALLLVGHPVANPTKDIPPDYDDVSLLHVLKLEMLIPA